MYLLLDGQRTQRRILDELGRYSIQASQPTVSRRMDEMSSEYGIADLVIGGNSKVYRKNREMEDVLNLSKRVREWLESTGRTIPQALVTRKKSKSNG
jgi:arginine repressor